MSFKFHFILNIQHGYNTDELQYLKCIESFCLPHDYSSSTIPKDGIEISGLAKKSTIEVTLEYTDVDILEVSDLKHTIKMVMYLGVHWKEPRLVCPQGKRKSNKIPLDIQFLDHLWIPDLDIYNIKEIQEFKLLKKFAGTNKLCYDAFHGKLNSFTV